MLAYLLILFKDTPVMTFQVGVYASDDDDNDDDDHVNNNNNNNNNDNCSTTVSWFFSSCRLVHSLVNLRYGLVGKASEI